MFSIWYGCETCRRSFLKLDDLFQHKEEHPFEDSGIQCKEQIVSFSPSSSLSNLGSRRKLSQAHYNPFVLVRRLSRQQIQNSSISKNVWSAKYTVEASASAALPTAKRSPNNVINFLKCKLCLDKFNSESELTVHLNTCALSHQHCSRFCVPCNLKFHNKHNLKRHISRRHVVTKDETATFNNAKDREHCLMKVQYKPDELSSHALTYPTKEQTQKGTLYFGQKRFICHQPGCGKRFQERHHLTRHLVAHSDAKPFMCPEPSCGMYFKTKDNARKHARAVHSTYSLSFKCSQNNCGESFKDNQTMLRPLLTHSARGSFKCPEGSCLKTFKNKDSARYHMKKHSDQLRTIIKCSQADIQKSFQGKINHLEYQIKRSRARPFKCHYQNCKKAFAIRRNLNHHLEGHSQSVTNGTTSKTTHGVLSLKCKKQNCGKRFANVGNLKRHLQTIHSDDKPFKCPVPTCEFKCKQKSTIKGHLRTKIHANLINLRVPINNN